VEIYNIKIAFIRKKNKLNFFLKIMIRKEINFMYCVRDRADYPFFGVGMALQKRYEREPGGLFDFFL
jgi:hypothetical protein